MLQLHSHNAFQAGWDMSGFKRRASNTVPKVSVNDWSACTDEQPACCCPSMSANCGLTNQDIFIEMFRSISKIRFQAVRQPLRRRLTCLNTAIHTANVERSEPLEEETLPHYDHDQFYPVRVGQHLGSDYKVLGKLGYGAYSTVWLCRDMRSIY